MTARQVFEYALIENNKQKAPSLLLEDYNYFINKVINQTINKIYNLYDVNQQKSDDLRVLKSTAMLTPTLNDDYGTSALYSNVYEVELPDDYLIILNCVVDFKVDRDFKFYDYKKKKTIQNNNMKEDIKYPEHENVERVSGNRYGNKTKVRMEIRYGKDNSLFIPNRVYVDYLKAPQFIRLTQEQVDLVEDTSQVLEFPDYVCQEIVNDLVKVLMENASDPRLQTHIPINQSIAPPAQEQPKK